MKILVCVGNVPDTTTKVRFAEKNTKFDTNGVQWVINPWDELALTRALELKEDSSNPVVHVTVATVGRAGAEPTMRKALAIGADDAIRIDTDPEDSSFVAYQLAEVIKNEDYQLVLCGIESSDYNGAAVGGMLSEYLDLPSVSAVTGMTFEGADIILSREIDGGIEEVSLPAPFVAVVQKGIAKEPRIPAMRGIMMARKKPLKVVEVAEAETLTNMTEFEMPKPKPPCKMIEAENVAELVDLLQNEAKVL
ncbi:MAG: electron transfer flavoprotein subunit beta/FixA family protein [Bacteroidetes bacterium]|jgi:electron transfer flavoprotein beta subunit|nr:electron transfer flavoprotein subunit beta/FixA family protein [Bacteroidota bacterium]MBT3749104.1 electron transfer flavoprotein subunit beta/FixA family protein [Bacteroidota bacterium]MBT4399691.1 electron transfer flavoprotein subunit beta/FixA family protein [Bacteroidota bacterium]MBT4409904.1 electron transfer flavoprotein subunit beta/FixA family protein [Bacteroidota bacterium]MBT5425351.1 electron transfer flavoprotein subunit beta/FixA family protein [Bacteroidota bacterium]